MNKPDADQVVLSWALMRMRATVDTSNSTIKAVERQIMLLQPLQKKLDEVTAMLTGAHPRADSMNSDDVDAQRAAFLTLTRGSIGKLVAMRDDMQQAVAAANETITFVQDLLFEQTPHCRWCDQTATYWFRSSEDGPAQPRSFACDRHSTCHVGDCEHRAAWQAARYDDKQWFLRCNADPTHEVRTVDGVDPVSMYRLDEYHRWAIGFDAVNSDPNCN